MILADTDLLSAMAKIGRLPLLFAVLRTTESWITPGVFRELEHSFNLGRPYAKELFGLIRAGQIRMLSLTPDEVTFEKDLPGSLGRGERESIVVAKERGGLVLSNESRVAHHCRQHGIPCLRLPDILRALWVTGVVSKQEVSDIIDELQVKDRMRFKQSTLEAILN